MSIAGAATFLSFSLLFPMFLFFFLFFSFRWRCEVPNMLHGHKGVQSFSTSFFQRYAQIRRPFSFTFLNRPLFHLLRKYIRALLFPFFFFFSRALANPSLNFFLFFFLFLSLRHPMSTLKRGAPFLSLFCPSLKSFVLVPPSLSPFLHPRRPGAGMRT